MKKTIALAALLAATAFTPALAQDIATAAEPTPIPERVMVEMAQNAQSQRERGPRGGGEMRQGNGGGDRGQGGWQRQQQAAPVQQAAPAPQQQAAPPMPVQRQWNRAENGGQVWQGRARQEAIIRANPDGQVGLGQRQRIWQNREQRRDGWQDRAQSSAGNASGAVVVQQQQQQQPDRRWNGQFRNDAQGNRAPNNDVRRNDVLRSDALRNDVQRNEGRRNDNWQTQRRNDGQWNGNGVTRRNDTWRNNGQWNGNVRNDTWRNNGRFDQRQWQNQYRDWNRNWSRDWRRDQRYDWQRYRFTNRGLFQGGQYFAPYGWDYGYRRFSIGFSLSNLLFDQQYWINDPFAYRLPPVYGPFRWVRYYDDVLLVDLRSGQVVDAIYDFFW